MDSYLKYIILVFIFISFNGRLIAQCDQAPLVYNKIDKTSIVKGVYQPTTLWSEIKYIGRPKDSIYVGVPNNLKQALKSRTVDESERNHFNFYSLGRLKVMACAENIVKMYVWEHERDKPPSVSQYLMLVVQNIDSLPIEISKRKLTNIGVETNTRGQDWLKAAKPSSFKICGGDKGYYIKPNEVAVFSIPLLNIPRATEVRFNIGASYSNIIDSSFGKNNE